MKIVPKRDLRPYGTMTTRVSKRSKLKTLILSILQDPDRKAKSINPSLREARGTTGRANALHETMRYAPNPGPDGWKTTTAIAKVTTMTMDAWKNCTQ
jgi:hypothetical protein